MKVSENIQKAIDSMIKAEESNTVIEKAFHSRRADIYLKKSQSDSAEEN